MCVVSVAEFEDVAMIDDDWAVRDDDWAVRDDDWAVRDDDWAVRDDDWAVRDDDWAVRDDDWAVCDDDRDGLTPEESKAYIDEIMKSQDLHMQLRKSMGELEFYEWCTEFCFK